MKAAAELPPATPESVWETLREIATMIKESEARFNLEWEKESAEREKSRAEFEKKMEESRIASDRRMKKVEKFWVHGLTITDCLLKNILSTPLKISI